MPLDGGKKQKTTNICLGRCYYIFMSSENNKIDSEREGNREKRCSRVLLANTWIEAWAKQSARTAAIAVTVPGSFFG